MVGLDRSEIWRRPMLLRRGTSFLIDVLCVCACQRPPHVIPTQITRTRQYCLEDPTGNAEVRGAFN